MKHAAVLALTAGVLLACGRAPAPPPSLPSLTRPVVTLAPVANGQPGLFVPRAAYAERAGVPGVFVLHENRARFRMVRAGRSKDGAIEILGGLAGTETLVLGDLQDVRDGSPIQALK